MILHCYQHSGSQNWRWCPQAWQRSRGRGGRTNCLSVQSSLGVLGAAMPHSTDTFVRKPGQVQFTAEKPKCCSWPLLIDSFCRSPDFLPSVMHPLINILVCHIVSACQMTITKKVGQSWPTAKVWEELCRTTEEYAPTESSYVRYCVGSVFLNPQFFTLLSFLLSFHIFE